MIRYLPLALTLALAAPTVSNAQAATNQRQEVLAFIRAYIDAFNRADMNAFVDAYAQRSDLIRIKNGEVTRGWEAIRNEANHTKGADRVSAGVVEVVSLSATMALAVVPFAATVNTQQGVVQLRGAMSLVVQKTPDGWRIIHDHTSSSAPGQ